MESSFKVHQTKNGSDSLVKLSGHIDENADYTKISLGGLISVTLDMEEIKLINSSGLQRWISFIESIPGDIKVYLARCSTRVINQINLFPGFLAGRDIRIISFQAPYYCEKCDIAYNIVLDTVQDFKNSKDFMPPEKVCEKCSSKLDFDGLPKKYFSFLSRREKDG
ncbi:MAG: hypothetical protein HQK54_16140, partial [Oligoflexales bacterium]|nr:hypothetical protein [Oligoflexales bacterium]